MAWRWALLAAKRVSAANALTALMMVWLVFRMCWLCLPNPIIGYANNFDFVRQSSCTGLWQEGAGTARYASHPQAPQQQLIFDGVKKPDMCQRSSDNLFPWFVEQFYQKGSRIDLREIGAAKIALTMLVLLTCLSLPMPGPLRAGAAVAAALIFGDVAILCYFNTLYTESASVIGTFAVLVLLCVLTAHRGRVSHACITLFGAFLVYAGESRQQSLYLPIIVGLISAGLLLRMGQRVRAFGIIGVTCAILLFHVILNQGGRGLGSAINMANRTDTFMGAVLPAASDKAEALHVLGLPARCLQGLGKDWYANGVQAKPPCPEAFAVSRARLLPLFIVQPSSFYLPMYRAAESSRPFLLNNIGFVGGPAAEPPIGLRFVMDTSLSTLIDRLQDWQYMTILVFALAAGLAAGIVAFKRQGALRGSLTMIAAGCLTGIYALASSVFGDGYFDMPRHAIGVLIGLSLQAGGIAATMWSLLREQRPRLQTR